VLLKEFAETAQLSFAVVKHFSSRRILDADLVWLVGYPDARMLSDLGLTPGQSHMLRHFADAKIDEAVFLDSSQ
jgi:hypothetical protein